jgi:hypothetical protein
VKLSEIEVLEAVESDSLPQLMDLFASAWWTAGRTVGDLTRMLAASDLVFALNHRPAGRLVDFGRIQRLMWRVVGYAPGGSGLVHSACVLADAASRAPMPGYPMWTV